MPLCAKIGIEIPLLIFVFAIVFADSVSTNWIIFRTCYVTLGYNRSECALLGSRHPDNTTAKLEEIVEPHASIIIMTKRLIEAFGIPLICFFLGPWSDEYGRKPVFLLTIAGIALQYLISAIVCVIPNLSPWFILLSVIPLFFTGGFMAIIAAILCYINDITSTENRGTRIALFYAVITVGFLLASLSAPPALVILGYFVMYLTTFCSLILAWLIIFLFVEESIQNPGTEGKYRNLLKLSLIGDTVKTTFKRRDNYDRLMLLIILLVLIVYVLVDNASSITFLYMREEFQWSLETFNIYVAINTVIGTFGSLVGVYLFHKLLKINESFVIVMGYISTISSCIVLGLADKTWHIYAAGLLGCLSGTISPMSRSLISKIVSADEYGKVFSFLAVCESFISPLGSPLFTFIYNHTLLTFPGTFLLVAAGISLIGGIFSILAILIQRITVAPNNYQMLNSQARIN